jgi:chromosome segregation ATPase
MSQSTSYAQALNEARQLIVQQQYRIKADADKIRSQQQTIVDQSNTLSETERKARDQATELERLTGEVSALAQKLQEAIVARTQVESVLDQQGQRIGGLQTTISEMEKTIAEQAGRIDEQSKEIADLQAERDSLSSKLPSQEDVDALSQMMDLLSRRPESMKRAAAGPTLKLADVVSTSDETPAPPQAQAA